MIYIIILLCLSCPKCVGRITDAHAQSQLGTPVLFIRLRDRATLAWTEEKNVHLEIENLKQTEFQRLKIEERKAEDKMRK